MKAISTSFDIEDLALELGATVTHEDGRVFNSSGRAGVVRRLKPTPTVAAPAAPAPAEDGTAKLTAALAEMISKLQAQPAPVVNVPPAQVLVNPQPRTAWQFDFARNPDGTIKSIKATPVKE